MNEREPKPPMLMNAAYPELEAELDAAKTLGQVDAALRKVADLVTRYPDPETFGLALFTEGLDELMPKVAETLKLEDVSTPKSNDSVCIVATRFYLTGGHTRVVRDIARLLPPDQRPVLILTSTSGGEALRYRAMMPGYGPPSDFGERGFLLLSAGTLIEKIVELYQMLKAIRASRIILACHPFDVAAIVAAWPFREVVDFVHHVDHTPALGASLPFSAHVDLTYSCHRACCAAGLDAVFAGMTSKVVDAPPHARAPGRLRIATCGDERKYEGARRYRWADYAVAALRQPGAKLMHIGAVSDALKAEIREVLTSAGLDPARYDFVGEKESLPATLIEAGADLFLASYPVDGGKANLEAMLAGVPVIAPSDPDTPPLMRFSLPLQNYVEISSPDELAHGVAEALALGEAMRTPEQISARAREVARFADFVALKPLSPA